MKNVTFKDCWFKDADTPFSFKSIDNVTIDNLYLGGKLIEYDSQVDLTVADSVKNFTFLVNGENIKKNAAPVFENPDNEPFNVKAGETVSFQVNATDPEENNVTLSVVGALPKGASFDAETGAFTWETSDISIIKRNILRTNYHTSALMRAQFRIRFVPAVVISSRTSVSVRKMMYQKHFRQHWQK